MYAKFKDSGMLFTACRLNFYPLNALTRAMDLSRCETEKARMIFVESKAPGSTV